MSMSKGTKRIIDDMEFDSLSIKHIRRHVTCLVDLSNEILLSICRYLFPIDVLYSFYTPEKPELRLHYAISDYYTKIKLDGVSNNGYNYLLALFNYSKNPFRPHSLILTNEGVSFLIQRYLSSIDTDIIRSIFNNLRSLTVIDCSSEDLDIIEIYYTCMIQLQYLHITVRKTGEHLIETIDDLYVLLDGLVPNVEKMIIQISQSRILSYIWPESPPSCLRLTEFTLLDSSIELDIDNIKSILPFMPNLIKLTLSIRNTPDPMFCHGPYLESTLNKYLPQLRQFDYTMTHRLVDQILIGDFTRWSMHVVFNENKDYKWVHIYSLPWPSNKDDKRRLPIVKGECNTSVQSDVKIFEWLDHVLITKPSELIQLKTHFRRARKITTDISIHIALPKRICKIIYTKPILVNSTNVIVQPFVRHLVVQYRLTDVEEISNFAHQFPYVKYLELLFPPNENLFLECFQTLFSVYDYINAKRRFWSYLISFSTRFFYDGLDKNLTNLDIHYWLTRNTDLKFLKRQFCVNCSNSILSIWF
ncbi:unnamed protein product [Rotaria sordida]|uniref:F-box domain-containing protein n=1 Tax=Rotaria sordida TaxID=392033 RepID=A0A815N9M2_9BILA|nr:unnamed protein product [Rotaria sordida]CAF4115207.1 unnamed protein product [Rotaria sordida]